MHILFPEGWVKNLTRFQHLFLKCCPLCGYLLFGTFIRVEVISTSVTFNFGSTLWNVFVFLPILVLLPVMVHNRSNIPLTFGISNDHSYVLR